MSLRGVGRLARYDDVMQALREVSDPEMPVVSIVDLGIVERVAIEDDRVVVDLLPTFTGCPAVGMMARAAEARIRALPWVREARAALRLEPVWSSERINERGRLALRSLGVAPPGPVAVCPYCGSRHTRVTAAFGPTRCRMACYCDECRNPFEQMKAV